MRKPDAQAKLFPIQPSFSPLSLPLPSGFLPAWVTDQSVLISNLRLIPFPDKGILATEGRDNPAFIYYWRELKIPPWSTIAHYSLSPIKCPLRTNTRQLCISLCIKINISSHVYSTIDDWICIAVEFETLRHMEKSFGKSKKYFYVSLEKRQLLDTLHAW